MRSKDNSKARKSHKHGDFLALVIDLLPYWLHFSNFQLCREKKELQKILDRKRQNSISEARNRDKEKAEM